MVLRAYAVSISDSSEVRVRSVELADRAPAPDQVCIDVEFAGLGMIDALWASGFVPSGNGFIPGLEVAGKIRSLGSDVSGLEIGQPVASFLPGVGGLAEIACAPASTTAVLPIGLDPALASVVPSNTVTAHLAMTTVARLEQGESVLVQAGVGGLGSQFAQVARLLGAGRIDAIVGTPEKQQAALKLGYANAYLRENLPSVPSGTYDLVVDPVGGEGFTHGFRVLRSGGRLIKVGNASQSDDVPVSSLSHWQENKSTIGFHVGEWTRNHPLQGARSLRWALDAVAKGDITVELSEVGSWEDVPRLLDSLLSGSIIGKVAVRVS